MRVFLSPFVKFALIFTVFAAAAADLPAQRSSRKTVAQPDTAAAVDVPGSTKLRVALDTDKDGKADYTVFRPKDNIWYTQKSGGSFSGNQWGWAGNDMFVPGDYDGDGIGDIAVWRDSDGGWYVLNSSTGNATFRAWGMAGDEPVARDYDGDGKTDIAIVRRSDGVMTWHILRSQLGPIAIPWGATSDFATPGDYDGDGKFDVSIQRPGPTATSAATFHTLNSRDNTVTQQTWGFASDLVVPGDYDGDGKMDYAVFREGKTPEAPVEWWILRSRDGVIGYSFGQTGTDYNVQNDYDGDGTTDIAVWRNSDGTFWIRRSFDGSVYGVQWGAPNDFPVASYDTH